MDKLNHYRHVIETILNERLQWTAGESLSDGEQCVSFDRHRDQYLWFHVGWREKKRDFGIAAYLRIKDGKVWIEEDWTEEGLASELLEAGVPSEDIVLGFQHPSKRYLTEFSTGTTPIPTKSIPTALSDDRLRA